MDPKEASTKLKILLQIKTVLVLVGNGICPQNYLHKESGIKFGVQLNDRLNVAVLHFLTAWAVAVTT